MSENKAELIKEGSTAIDKLTTSAHTKTLAFCLVVSIIFAGAFAYMWAQAKNENTALLKAQIRIEIERQLPSEVTKQVQPISDSWENAKDKIDTLINDTR